ncbi:tyrosine-type recombinase/integrase [Muricauda sp. JGD-17]|uniref:Tyrosine-type recombinase/integrase n=1 Tax=Flagellimonas ochracea TaxID=2696472 RepID=A0A964TFD1_9FLAO|nr:site-specific integrase [Allomuricauda ochracea]NAY92671.1 tyrosine-type recombinase/integrase [Allomuricauda ochracea]
MYGKLNILFYPKKLRSDTDGKAMIYARVTINGKRSEFSLGRRVEEQRWDSRGGKLRGTTTEVSNFNRFLDNVKNRLYDIYDSLLKEREDISAAIIKNIYLGKEGKEYMLLEIFQEHNDEIESLLGKGFTKGTLQRYKAAYKHVSAYIIQNYHRNDIPVRRVDHKFITGLEFFLKSQRNCEHNTAIKYVVNFKKIMRIALANEWITKDPFFHWKASWKTKEKQYLTQTELDALRDKKSFLPRLDLVRDVFVFCCYTGLAYSDVQQLKEEHIIIGVNGDRWIKMPRKKTKAISSIPLLAPAEEIILKYRSHPYVLDGKGVLPVLTNQKSNAYLKEIADVCGINKNLTTHLARHTFATTVTLSNGVSISTVSKMLGHRSLKTTQIYAKVLDSKIAEEMDRLKEKIKPVENSNPKDEGSIEN